MRAFLDFLPWQRGRGRLFPNLKSQLEGGRPITLQRYMETVLQDAEHGYYRHGHPAGFGRDFHTAPEASQMFGEILGFWCLDTWQRMGAPDPFILLELGPGNGTMLSDLLHFTEAVPAFHKALHVRLLETNATLRDRQKQKIQGVPLRFCDNLSQLEPWPTLVLANEFFDTMPLHQFVKEGDTWRETCVSLKDGKPLFVMAEEPCSLPEGALSADLWRKQKDDWVYEIAPDSRRFAKQVAAHIKKCGGAGLFIDYGYVVPPGHGTLAGRRRGRPEDVLAYPGKTAVTADVDFAALCRWLDEEGVCAIEPVAQGSFLHSWGIETRADFLAKNASVRMKRRIEEALHILTSFEGMGALWKVLAFYR